MTAVRLGVVALALALAAIHIMLAIRQAMIGFYLNGEGYVALAAALYLSPLMPYRRLVCWHGPDHHPLHADRPPYYTTIGYVDKAIEAALIVLVWLDQRRSKP
jgi:hypothetical protein